MLGRVHRECIAVPAIVNTFSSTGAAGGFSGAVVASVGASFDAWVVVRQALVAVCPDLDSRLGIHLGTSGKHLNITRMYTEG